MVSDRKIVIDWMFRRDLSHGEFDFDDVLLEAAQAALGKNAISAAAYVAGQSNQIWNAAVQRSNDYKRNGAYPLFNIINYARRKGAWLPDTSKAGISEKKLLTRIRARPPILRVIDQFTDREYEAAGCVIANLAGADRVKLTPSGNEGGIDFFARVRNPGISNIFSGKYAPMRIIGQSKKHRDKITVKDVRELYTTITSVQTAGNHTESQVPTWFRSSPGPIFGWINGHSGFQSGAITLANNFGIILSDSIILADAVARSRSLIQYSKPQDRADKFQQEVINFLAQNT